MPSSVEKLDAVLSTKDCENTDNHTHCALSELLSYVARGRGCRQDSQHIDITPASINLQPVRNSSVNQSHEVSSSYQHLPVVLMSDAPEGPLLVV